jgi:hypothetical protein
MSTISLPEISEKDQARFWSKVALPNEQGCMLWLKWTNNKGYGQFSLKRRHVYAHRVSYVLAYGQIPDGLVVDHVKAEGCTNRHCVAPAHLEAVTYSENALRGDMRSNNVNYRKTRCLNGHPFDDENTIRAGDGSRRCRECARARTRAWRKRQKEAA